MAHTNTFARTLNDVGLAAWFGGSLMGAVGLNGAAAAVDDPRQRAHVANAGWSRWTPVNLAAIAAHVVGGTLLLRGNKGRFVAQSGVASAATAKTVCKLTAMAATAYARVLGERVIQAGDVPVEGGTTPGDSTPHEVEQAQRQLSVLQWAIPVLTGATLVLNARMGEQQRPKEVLSGMARRLTPDALAALVARN